MYSSYRAANDDHSLLPLMVRASAVFSAADVPIVIVFAVVIVVRITPLRTFDLALRRPARHVDEKDFADAKEEAHKEQDVQP